MTIQQIECPDCGIFLTSSDFDNGTEKLTYIINEEGIWCWNCWICGCYFETDQYGNILYVEGETV